MIWGCNWDVTCNFIKSDPRVNNNITDSSAYGNYKNVDVKASDDPNETEIIKAGGTADSNSVKLPTGKTTYTKTNNIFDLAGNCTEWTQEAHASYGRAKRGGAFSSTGPWMPVADRSEDYASYPSSDRTSRPVLYVM